MKASAILVSFTVGVPAVTTHTTVTDPALPVNESWPTNNKASAISVKSSVITSALTTIKVPVRASVAVVTATSTSVLEVYSLSSYLDVA